MNIFEAIILGLVQGLTEFIPVSSSGHLEIIPKIFGWNEPSTVFITFLHFGTLLSLLFFYRTLIIHHIQSFYLFIFKKDLSKEDRANIKTGVNIIVATIPAAVIGLIFEKFISDFYDSGENSQLASLITTFGLISIGILFLFSNRIFNNKKFDLTKLGKKGAFIIGVSQTFAFIRGVSRSGITLLSGQAVGLKRVSAAEFGFLMSIPIITATSVYGIYGLLKLPSEEFNAQITPAIVGFFVAFISGVIAIKFMLKFLKSNGLSSFGIYRIIFGIVALLLLL